MAMDPAVIYLETYVSNVVITSFDINYSSKIKKISFETEVA